MSVRQEKKSKWTNDGRSWFYDVYYFDIYGKRKEKKSKLFKTQKEAKNAERDFLNSLENNDIDNRTIDFETVFNEWLEYKKKIIKSTTYYRLKKNLSKNILQYFKDYKLQSIKINSINNYLIWLNDRGSTLKYQNSIIGYLKELLTYAKEIYNFDNKVVAKIQKYRIETVDNKQKDAEWNFWTYEEFNTFIKYVDNDFYNLMFKFLYYTGLRLGEMIALNWNDIDLNKKTVKIYKNFSNKLGNNSYRIIDPKTKNSVRNVDLDDNLVSLLKEYKLKEENIYNFNNNMFVFGNVRYSSPTTIARHLNKYIEEVKKELPNFKRITPHGFRHSHVSLLIYLGCDSRDVAERIGDTVQMVESTYYHMFPNKKSRTINYLNNIEKYEVNTRYLN